MKLSAVLDYFCGCRRVRCDKKDSSAIANIMLINKLQYRDMKSGDDGLFFTLTDGEYKKLLLLTDGKGIEINTVEKKGVPHILKRYRKRPGILLGIIMLLVLTKLSTMYVWDVKVEGNENISDAEVITSLEQLGFFVGSYIPEVDFYSLCNKFVLENDNVSWISVNMEGTTAVVKLIERDKKGTPEDGNGTPSNIVARYEGEIIRTETASGQLSVSVGDKVEAGQLLISGIVEIGQADSGRFTLVRSIGRIFAKTQRSFVVEVPLESVKNTLKERIVVEKTIKFFGKSIKLKENSSILDTDCDIITTNRRVVLFEGISDTGEIPLPVTVITRYAEIYEEVNVTYTEEEALAIAEAEMAEIVLSELSSAELLSKEVLCEVLDGVLILRWNLECVEDIALETPIGLV